MIQSVAEGPQGSLDDLARGVYVAMIQLGHPTLAALVDQGLSESEVRLTADLLISRGLIVPSGPDAWEVNPPDAALHRYAEQMEHDARTTRATAANLASLWRMATEETLPQVVEGLELIGSATGLALATRYLVERTERQLWWAVGGSPASRQLLHPSLGQGPGVTIAPGTQVGILVDRSALDLQGMLAELDRHVAFGHQVRVINRLAFTVVVSDDDTVLVDLSHLDPHGDGSFETTRPNIVAAMTGWLTIVWEEAVPLASIVDQTGHLHAHSVDARDRRILALLANGLSDHVIARDLGISTRTVERRVRDLMNRLTATTRFQAGVQAVRRGWI
jgi:DNA-binding CsgD family transcriptional regulator